MLETQLFIIIYFHFEMLPVILSSLFQEFCVKSPRSGFILCFLCHSTDKEINKRKPKHLESQHFSGSGVLSDRNKGLLVFLTVYHYQSKKTMNNEQSSHSVLFKNYF